MYKLIITNSFGQSLRLSQNGAYEILSIEGLTPPTAVVNSSSIGGADGALFNSTRMNVRNIVVTIAPNFPIEKNRIALYKLFQVKDLVKLRYITESRDVVIEGYVESFIGNPFTARQQFQISILCLQPYFKSANEVINDLSQILSEFEFPFSTEDEGTIFSEIDLIQYVAITNDGETDTGLVIELTAIGEVVNPVIYDATNLTNISLNLTMQTGDFIRINTNYSNKSIKLIRNAIEYNIINNVNGQLTWFNLAPGETVFAYDAESGAEFLSIRFYHNTLYQGV